MIMGCEYLEKGDAMFLIRHLSLLTTGSGDDGGHLLDLLLGTNESTESLLCELTGTLVGAVLE